MNNTCGYAPSFGNGTNFGGFGWNPSCFGSNPFGWQSGWQNNWPCNWNAGAFPGSAFGCSPNAANPCWNPTSAFGSAPNVAWNQSNSIPFGCLGNACPDFTGNGCCMTANNCTFAWTPFGCIPVSVTCGSPFGPIPPMSNSWPNSWTSPMSHCFASNGLASNCFPTSCFPSGSFGWNATPNAFASSPCPPFASAPWNWSPNGFPFSTNCFPNWSANCAQPWGQTWGQTWGQCFPWNTFGSPAASSFATPTWTPSAYNCVSPFGGFGPVCPLPAASGTFGYQPFGAPTCGPVLAPFSSPFCAPFCPPMGIAFGGPTCIQPWWQQSQGWSGGPNAASSNYVNGGKTTSSTPSSTSTGGYGAPNGIGNFGGGMPSNACGPTSYGDACCQPLGRNAA